MGKLYPDLRKLLEAAGCFFLRQGKGSHELWHSPVNSRTFTVPYTIKSRRLANEILKQAGLGTRI